MEKKLHKILKHTVLYNITRLFIAVVYYKGCDYFTTCHMKPVEILLRLIEPVLINNVKIVYQVEILN